VTTGAPHPVIPAKAVACAAAPRARHPGPGRGRSRGRDPRSSPGPSAGYPRAVAARCLSLPAHPYLEPAEQERVAAALEAPPSPK